MLFNPIVKLGFLGTIIPTRPAGTPTIQPDDGLVCLRAFPGQNKKFSASDTVQFVDRI